MCWSGMGVLSVRDLSHLSAWLNATGNHSCLWPSNCITPPSESLLDLFTPSYYSSLHCSFQALFTIILCCIFICFTLMNLLLLIYFVIFCNETISPQGWIKYSESESCSIKCGRNAISPNQTRSMAERLSRFESESANDERKRTMTVPLHLLYHSEYVSIATACRLLIFQIWGSIFGATFMWAQQNLEASVKGAKAYYNRIALHVEWEIYIAYAQA